MRKLSWPAASLLIAGCAGVQAGGGGAAVGLAKGRFTPGPAPAANYGPDAARTCPTAGVGDLLNFELESSSKQSGKAKANPEGRLCAVAGALLGWEGTEVPEHVGRFISAHFGLVAPLTRVVIAVIESEDSKDLATRLAEPLVAFAPGAVNPRYGVASYRLRKDATKVALVMQDMVADVDPFPRRLAADGQASLGGKVFGAFENPKVLISDPQGRLETPAQQPGKSFRAEARCGGHAGRMHVEIRAEQGGQEHTVGSFPVACGGEEAQASVATAAPAPPAGDAAAQGRATLDAINAERTAAGLKALSWSDDLAKVARSAAEGRREGAAVDLVAKLREADLTYPLVLENPAAARTADEAHLRFSLSPSHRSNYMNPDVTHAGIGVATSPRGMIVCELFVKELPAADTEGMRGKIREAVFQKRKDARAGPLVSDETLERVAQDYAREMSLAKGEVAKEKIDAVLKPVQGAFKSVHVISGAKADPADFAEEPGIVGREGLVGVGVAQGQHPVLGRNALWVVIVLGAR